MKLYKDNNGLWVVDCIHYQFELTEEYIQILRPEIEIDVM